MKGKTVRGAQSLENVAALRVCEERWQKFALTRVALGNSLPKALEQVSLPSPSSVQQVALCELLSLIGKSDTRNS